MFASNQAELAVKWFEPGLLRSRSGRLSFGFDFAVGSSLRRLLAAADAVAAAAAAAAGAASASFSIMEVIRH